MAGKVKVSREVAEALESAFEVYKANSNPENAILEHTMNGTWAEERTALHKLEPIKLAEILVKGYEIEETPDEILLERYIQNNKNRIKAIQEKDSYQEGFTLGYSMGVKDGLNFSDKKIKGINE